MKISEGSLLHTVVYVFPVVPLRVSVCLFVHSFINMLALFLCGTFLGCPQRLETAVTSHHQGLPFMLKAQATAFDKSLTCSCLASVKKVVCSISYILNYVDHNAS